MIIIIIQCTVFGFTILGCCCSTSLPVDILQFDTVKVPPTSHHYHEKYWYEKNAMLDLQPQQFQSSLPFSLSPHSICPDDQHSHSEANPGFPS